MDAVQSTQSLPRWMWGIVAIEIAVPTFFGIASIADPGIWGAESLGALGQLYVVRNFAMAFGVALAAFVLRSHIALLVAIAARYVTDFVDISASIARGVEGEALVVTAVFVLLLLVLPLFGLRWLIEHR
ncbi:MAG: hypothetical protein AAFR46_05870 [Pseudomonadota bacterium]